MTLAAVFWCLLVLYALWQTAMTRVATLQHAQSHWIDVQPADFGCVLEVGIALGWKEETSDVLESSTVGFYSWEGGTSLHIYRQSSAQLMMCYGTQVGG